MASHSFETSLKYPIIWHTLAVMLLATIAVGSLAPISLSIPGSNIPNFDKVLHLLAYALLTAWYLAVFSGRYSRLIIPVFTLGVGVALEWLQGMTGYRDASLGDALADLVGILLASLVLVTPIRQSMNIIEQRLLGAEFARPPRPRKRQSLKFRALWQVIGMHLAVALLISAFTPIEVGNIPIPHIDKILHFAAYGTLTAWFLIVTRSRRFKILIPLAMFILSISVELMQGITDFGGEPSILDAFADTIGILLASLIVAPPLKHGLLSLEGIFHTPHRRRKPQSALTSTPYRRNPS